MLLDQIKQDMSDTNHHIAFQRTVMTAGGKIVTG